MEAAALRAVVMQTANYISVHAILQKGQDKLPLLIDQPDAPPIIHDNIRGEVYFDEKPAEDANNA
jgi:hypothetical protein